MAKREKVIISSLTRHLGSAEVDLELEGDKIVHARIITPVFRGFELMLRGRDPLDAPYFASRICGICSTAHAVAAAFALEALAGYTCPANATLLRNMIQGAEHLQNHIRQLYLFAIPDYVRMPRQAPYVPRWEQDYRLPEELNNQLLEHYFQSFDISRLCHEIMVLLGGRAPHTHGIMAGGSCVPPGEPTLANIRSKIRIIANFIADCMVPDYTDLAAHYEDYFEIGTRPLSLIAARHFPRYPDDNTGHLPPGVVTDAGIEPFDPRQIREDFTHSYFEDPNSDGFGWGHATPNPDKDGAYTWAAAARYAGRPFEGGPLGQMWVAGLYRRGVSVMDRLLARAEQARLVSQLLGQWVDELEPGAPVFGEISIPDGEAMGITGAKRGPLIHRILVERGRIARYQVITPTTWHFSPADSKGQPGPVEEALLGTRIANPKEPMEAVRIIRSFDPCIACAGHLLRGGKEWSRFVLQI